MKFADILRGIDKVIHRILLVIAQVALFAMIAIVCTTVFYRYVLNKGTLVALFAFIACAMGVRDHLHIGVGFFYNRFKAGGMGRKVMDKIGNIATFACGGIMAYYGLNLCTQLWRFTMPATGFPRTVQYISMPIAGTIIMFDSLLFLFGVLAEDDHLYTEKEQELEVIHLKKHGDGKHEEKRA